MAEALTLDVLRAARPVVCCRLSHQGALFELVDEARSRPAERAGLHVGLQVGDSGRVVRGRRATGESTCSSLRSTGEDFYIKPGLTFLT